MKILTLSKTDQATLENYTAAKKKTKKIMWSAKTGFLKERPHTIEDNWQARYPRISCRH